MTSHNPVLGIVLLIGRGKFSANPKHYTDLAGRFSDVILLENEWWCREMWAVFLGYDLLESTVSTETGFGWFGWSSHNRPLFGWNTVIINFIGWVCSSFWSSWKNGGLFLFRYGKTSNKNMQLVLQHFCKTSSKAMLRVLPSKNQTCFAAIWSCYSCEKVVAKSRERSYFLQQIL